MLIWKISDINIDIFLSLVFIIFLTNAVNTSCMMINKPICQAPMYLDELYKVVSPPEVSPHEIENLKRFL